MNRELEEVLQELEVKLPDLRHLVLDSGEGLTGNPLAMALAARLLRVAAIADETAGYLRLVLLGGQAPYPEPLPPLPPLPPVLLSPAVESPAVAPVAAVAPSPASEATGADYLNEADQDLLEVLGLKESPHAPEGVDQPG